LSYRYGEAVIHHSYNKSSAATGYSFHTARYPSDDVSLMMALYLIYVRPFTTLLYNNIREDDEDALPRKKRKTGPPKKRTKTKSNLKLEKSTMSSSIVKSEKSKSEKSTTSLTIHSIERYRAAVRRRNQKANEIDLTQDRCYIYCSRKTPNICWKGRKLSDILQRDSVEWLGQRINLWMWRQILTGIVKTFLVEIAPFWEKDQRACKELLEANPYWAIFAWQAGHQKVAHDSYYGLDTAFPFRLTPEVLRMYRSISKLWHSWLGFTNNEDIEMRDMITVIGVDHKGTQTIFVPAEGCVPFPDWLKLAIDDDMQIQAWLDTAKKHHEAANRIQTRLDQLETDLNMLKMQKHRIEAMKNGVKESIKRKRDEIKKNRAN